MAHEHTTVSQKTMGNLLITQLGRQIVWSTCYTQMMDVTGRSIFAHLGPIVLGKEIDIYQMLRFYGEKS